jgi:hypothetical protein
MLKSNHINNFTLGKVLFFSLARIIVCLFILVTIGTGLNAQTLRLNKTVSNTSPAPGEPFNFVLDIACQSTTSPCEDVYISDFIPGSLEFLNFSSPLPSGVSGATYDAGTNEAVINFDSDQISAGTSIQIVVQVRFPYGTFDGTAADNTAFAFSSNGGDTSSSASATSTGGTTGGAGCDALPNDVTNDFEVLSPGEINQSAEIGNTGTEDIINWTYETELDENITLKQVRTPEFTDVDHPGELYYQSSDNPGVWVLWHNFNLNDRDTRNVSGLGLPSGAKVTHLKLELGTIPGDGQYNPYIYPSGYVRRFVYTSIVDDGLTTSDVIENCGTYFGVIDGTSCTGNDCRNASITEGSDYISTSKYLTDLNDVERTQYEIGDRVRVHLELASPPQQPNDVVGAVLTDILPAGVSYIPGTWYIEWGEENIDFQTPIEESGTMPDGRDFVRFVWDDSHGNEFTIEPTGSWDGFSIAFEVTIDAGIAQGWHTNNLYSNTTGSDHLDCSIQDTENYNNGYADDYCNPTYDFEVIYPPGSAGLDSKKEVRGSKNSNYNSYPDFGTTVPGGVSDYRISLTNSNSTPVDDLVIIDIFPFVGDTEILNPSDPRYSEWRPNLLAPLPTPSGGRVYYTTVTNPCRDELAGPSVATPFPAGCTDPGWTTTPPADITTVTGFKIDLGNRRLNQGQEFEYEWEMRAPVDAPTNGEMAWNSFAWAGSNATTGNPLIPAEPIKVGVESFPGSVPFHGDFVWDDLNGNGIQDPGEPGIDGVTITLYEDNGNGIANPGNDTPYMTTVSANGGQYLFSDFPLGNYFIEFSNLPSGYNPTHTDAGSNDAIDSDGLITPVMAFGSTTDDRTCDLGLFFGTPPPLCSLVASIDNSCSILNENTGLEDSGSTTFSDSYNGIPAELLPRRSEIIPGWRASFTCSPNDPCPDGYWINDINDQVNNPEGDKFVVLTADGYCLSTTIDLVAGQCYNLSFHAALYHNGSATDANVSIEYYETVFDVAKIGQQTVTSSSDFNNLNWSKINYTFTPTETKNYRLFFSYNNLSGPIAGGMAMDDLQITPCCDEICAGESYSLTATATGQNGGVRYNWSTGETTQTISVSPNTTTNYQVTITDSEDCESTTSATVVVNPEPTFSETDNSDVTCNGLSDGSVTLSGNGGSVPYTYSVSGQSSNTTGVFNNLSAGSYNLTITDNNGCEVTGTFNINEPDILECSIQRDQYVDCDCGENGQATVTATGGNGGYTYLWSNGETTQQATQLGEGTHTVTVTDSENCETTCTINMEINPECCFNIMSNGFLRNVARGN